MELYGRSSSGSQSDRAPGWVSVGPVTGLEDPMRRLGMLERGSGLYPERPGFTNCSFYMRTGSCGYGPKCRYNHPPRRDSVVGVVRFEGEPPLRPGELACQFYLRTGTCKFGSSCKFHHPRDGEGYTNVRFNSNGYPLRPDEPECSYYLKTGQCKFGIACKFHHPQQQQQQLQNNSSMTSIITAAAATSARPFYPSVQTSSLNQYGGSAASYRVGRPPPPPLLPTSYVPPGAFGPVLVPPGVVPIPSWTTFSGAVSPAMSQNAHPTAGSPYGVPQLSSSAPAFGGPYHTLSPSSLGPSSNSQKENVFPVRPGQPDCHFYLKTGNCKFGLCCKFNHPSDWELSSKANCVFSPLGLPLRPGVQPCSFYMQNNSCKFGRLCKFDHPMGTVRYSPSASSLTDAPYMIGSPLSTLTPSFSFTHLRPELITGTKSDIYLNQGPSSANISTSSLGLVFQQNRPAFLSNVELSSQIPLTIGISRT